jgi:hypothetical protein
MLLQNLDGLSSLRISSSGWLWFSGVEPSNSATRELIGKMDLREAGCEDGRWMELAQDRVQWPPFFHFFSVFFQIPIPENYLLGYWESSLIQSII